MTRKYLGHRFKNSQHRKRHFNELMQATVYIFRHRTCCFMQKNQLYVRYLDRSADACFIQRSYWIQWDTYLACVERFAILGGPLRFQKTADPELDTDSGSREKYIKQLVAKFIITEALRGHRHSEHYLQYWLNILAKMRNRRSSGDKSVKMTQTFDQIDNCISQHD